MSEDEIKKAIKEQARRVQGEDNLSVQTLLEEADLTTEELLGLAKQEQERIRLYSENSSD